MIVLDGYSITESSGALEGSTLVGTLARDSSAMAEDSTPMGALATKSVLGGTLSALSLDNSIDSLSHSIFLLRIIIIK
jgi:hypothetical protein